MEGRPSEIVDSNRVVARFAATVGAIGTLVLFAALGTVGQLVALLVFVYLALASSGGTVPLDALSGFFRFFAEFEPLRQILDGVRAILYFDARGEAGLTRAWIASGLGLIAWLALGILRAHDVFDRDPVDARCGTSSPNARARRAALGTRGGSARLGADTAGPGRPQRRRSGRPV